MTETYIGEADHAPWPWRLQVGGGESVCVRSPWCSFRRHRRCSFMVVRSTAVWTLSTSISSSRLALQSHQETPSTPPSKLYFTQRQMTTTTTQPKEI